MYESGFQSRKPGHLARILTYLLYESPEALIGEIDHRPFTSVSARAMGLATVPSIMHGSIIVSGAYLSHPSRHRSSHQPEYMKIEQLVLLKEPDIAEQLRRPRHKLGQEGIDRRPQARQIIGQPVQM